MSNRRTKAVLADDDDFDYDEPLDEDYDEQAETQISEEDEQHLILGTIQVRQQLEPGIQVTDQEIRDALWNYHYDIQKTLSFIRSKPSSVTASSHFTRLMWSLDKHKPKPKPQAQMSHGASKLTPSSTHFNPASRVLCTKKQKTRSPV